MVSFENLSGNLQDQHYNFHTRTAWYHCPANNIFWRNLSWCDNIYWSKIRNRTKHNKFYSKSEGHLVLSLCRYFSWWTINPRNWAAPPPPSKPASFSGAPQKVRILLKELPNLHLLCRLKPPYLAVHDNTPRILLMSPLHLHTVVVLPRCLALQQVQPKYASYK